jgi:TnsA endonuclease N terminal
MRSFPQKDYTILYEDGGDFQKDARPLCAPGGLMEELIDGPHRSKLTFVASPESTEPIELGRLRRVREPVSRSKSGVQGKVADVASGRSRHAESQNELNAFRVLLATAHPDAWQEQPFRLEYHHDGAKHRYTPDILVVWGANREVVEVKEDSEAEKPENQARFALIRELLAEHGYLFRLWKRSEICAEPRLTNVSLLLRYRCVDVSAAEHERIRRAFSSAPELSLRTVCETPGKTVPSVLRLVLDGTLHINWWEPFGLDARVSIAPIGRQVWPFPHLAPSRRQFQEAGCR